MSIELEDDDDGDLLTQIPAATAFIRDALRLRDANRAMRAAAVDDLSSSSRAPADPSASPGGVLVHCHAGVSRSAAIVVAHVMRARDVDPEEALRLVRLAHPRASPNEGFLAQLSLWHTMGCKLNMADEAYRLYSVAKLAREREYNGYVNATAAARPRRLRRRRRRARPLQRRRRLRRPRRRASRRRRRGGRENQLSKVPQTPRPRRQRAPAPARGGTRRVQLAKTREDGASRGRVRGIVDVPERLPAAPGVDARGGRRRRGGKTVLPAVRRQGGTFQLERVSVQLRRVGHPAFYVQSGKVDVMPYESGGGGTTAGPGETLVAGVFACRDSP